MEFTPPRDEHAVGIAEPMIRKSKNRYVHDGEHDIQLHVVLDNVQSNLQFQFYN